MKAFVILFALLAANSCLGGDLAISPAELNAAAIKNGFKAPHEEIYHMFYMYCDKYSKEELAMFLAQMLHESAGFYYTEEQACLMGNKCEGKYVDDVGLPGKKYYGRGYLQLTWGANYKAASLAINGTDVLLHEPELVASDIYVAMQTSIWFWDTKVKPVLGTSNEFGRTTKAINGGECKYPKYHPRAQKRWKIYSNVAEALNIVNKAKESGCYN